MAPVSTRNRPAIVDPLRIGELMRAIAGYHGDVSTKFALKLLPLTFVRPDELRLAEWSEFNLKAASWRIPAARSEDARAAPYAAQPSMIEDRGHAARGSSARH